MQEEAATREGRQAPGEAKYADALLVDFWPPGLGANTGLLLNPPNVYHLITAALANQYSSLLLIISLIYKKFLEIKEKKDQQTNIKNSQLDIHQKRKYKWFINT